MEETKIPKISIDLKQTAKGFWYLASLKINSDNFDEFNDLLDKTSFKAKEKLNELNIINSESFINKVNEKEQIFLNSEEEKLFSHLKKIRLELAKKENFPPYVIFHDLMLKKMAKQKPVSLESMKELIGEKKFDKYGAIFVREIFQFS